MSKMDILVWISVGFFLFLPYYLSIFSLDRKAPKLHIAFWILFHALNSFIIYFMQSNWYSIPTIFLIASAVYYVFSYVFQARNIPNEIKPDNMSMVVNNRKICQIYVVVLVLAVVVGIVDIVVIFTKSSSDMTFAGKVYISMLIIISWIQSVLYSYRIRHRYGVTVHRKN